MEENEQKPNQHPTEEEIPENEQKPNKQPTEEEIPANEQNQEKEVKTQENQEEFQPETEEIKENLFENPAKTELIGENPEKEQENCINNENLEFNSHENMNIMSKNSNTNEGNMNSNENIMNNNSTNENLLNNSNPNENIISNSNENINNINNNNNENPSNNNSEENTENPNKINPNPPENSLNFPNDSNITPTLEKPQEKSAFSKPPLKKLPKKPAASSRPKPQNFSEDTPIPVPQVNLDELPIGKPTHFDVSEYPPDYNMEKIPNNSANDGNAFPNNSEEISQLPLSDRLKSKVWKVRQQAFEELATKIESLSVSEALNEFPAKELIRFLNDSNPGAQEKALIAFKALVDKAKTGENSRNSSINLLEDEESEEILKVLTEKVLISSKNTVKKLGADILEQLFANTRDKKSFALKFLPLFNNKNPKAACTAIASFVELFQKFGVRKLEFLKPYLQEIEKIAGSSTVATVKTECLGFFKEAYRFLGPELIRIYTNKLKKQQIDELEKFFVENPFVAAKEPAIREIEEEKSEENGDNAGKHAKNSKGAVDPYDFVDPVEIFSRFNENWTNKVLNFEKWSERKEALEEFLRENAAVVRVNPSQTHAISAMHTMLKRLLLDSNVQVTISAIKIIGFLCRGLRKGFFAQAKALFPFLLEKLKEKRGTLLEETQKSLENMLFCLGLDEVFEVVKENLEGKNVQMKLNALVWVEKALGKYENLASFKNLMPVFKKLLDDGASEVRTQTLNLLAKLAKNASNDAKTLILNEIPAGKLGKFEEILKKSESSKEEHKENKETTKNISENAKNIKENANKITSKANEEEKNTKEIANNPKKIKENAGVSPTKEKKPAVLLEDNPYEEVNNVNEEDAEQNLREKGLKDEILKGLAHNDWKEKQKSLINLLNEENLPVIREHLEEILVVLRAKTKGFKENNINIMKELFVFLTNEHVLSRFDHKCFNIISPFLIEKANDAKFSAQITQILCKTSEKVRMKWLIPNILQTFSAKFSNNVKILQEILEQINKTLQYVSKSEETPLKDLVVFLKPQLSSTNLGLKHTLAGVLQTLLDLHGKKLVFAVFGEIPAGLLKNLKFEEEVEEIRSEASETRKKPGKPQENAKKAEKTEKKPEKSQEISEKQEKQAKSSEVSKSSTKKTLTKTPSSTNTKKSSANLLEKDSKSSVFSADVPRSLQKLKHKEWNVRKEGLEELEKTEFSAISRVPAQMAELLNALKSRLTDPNKPLARQFVVFSGKFIAKLDRETLKPHYKQLIMSLLANLSDKNAGVRAEIMQSLGVFREILGNESVVSLISQFYLSHESPEVKGELLRFLNEIEFVNEKFEAKALINPVLACLIDKNKEIRAQAELLLRKLIEKLGQNPFVQPIKDLKPALRKQIEQVFAKIAGGGRVDTENTDNRSFEDNKSKISQKSLAKNTTSATNINNLNSLNSKNLENSKENCEETAENLNEKQLSEENFEEFLRNGAFATEISKLQEAKKARLSKLEAENIEKKARKSVNLQQETMFCCENPKKCFESHRKCPLQRLLSSSKCKDQDFLIFEQYFSDHCNEISRGFSASLQEKLYKNTESFENIRFINGFFQYVLSNEKCIELQMIDELSDFFVQYLSFFLVKSLETTEELVVLTLETVIFLIKIIRFNCNQLSSLETLFFVYCVKLFLEKTLDFHAVIQKSFKTFLLSTVCNAKNVQNLQILLIFVFLNSEPDSPGLRYRVLKYLCEFFFDYTEPALEILGDLPEIYSDKAILSRIVAKFSEEDVVKRGKMSRNQLFFVKKMGDSESKNQELDKMINETKNSLARRATHGSSLSAFKRIETEISENPSKYYKQTSEIYQTSKETPNKYNETPINGAKPNEIPKKSSENLSKMDQIAEDILKNPIVNQQITAELFLADLRLLEDGNAAQKIDSLMFLSDLATSGLPEHGLLFEKHAEAILNSFLYVFKHAFALDARFTSESDRNPLQFLQYFLNMLQKSISSGLFLRFVEKGSSLKEFLEEICVKVLWEESFLANSGGYLGVNSNIMLLKLMNLIILRCLECGEHNNVIGSLLELLHKYRRINCSAYGKLQGLFAKSLLKLSKHVASFKENLKVERFLQRFHDYLEEFAGDHMEEEIGVCTIKSLLYEICKVFGENVWESYKKIRVCGGKNAFILEKFRFFKSFEKLPIIGGFL